jgi:hypothetical protein
MFQGPASRLHDFVVCCKGCQENIAARMLTMPDDWVIEVCPFCTERRRYLPQEILEDGFRTNTRPARRLVGIEGRIQCTPTGER